MNGHCMSERSRARRRPAVWAHITGLGIVLAAGCDAGRVLVSPPPPPPNAPILGSITVTAFVAGRDLDPDGFTVRLDNGPPTPIASQSPVHFRDVAPGAHTLQLDGIAANCEVDSPNPWRLMLDLEASRFATVRFDVFCMAHGTGRLRVALHRGFDTFGVSIDGGPVLQGYAPWLDVTDLAQGAHSARLVLDPGLCALDGDPDARPASVTAGRTAHVVFVVTCPLVVAVTTTGENQPAGYTAYIEDTEWYCYYCTGQPISATGAVTFRAFAQMEFRVSLRGVPQNCAASPASHSVVIPAGEGGSVAFTVSCR